MFETGMTGATANTPDKVLFGAGTIHRGLKMIDGEWNYEESLAGATDGGSRWTVAPKLRTIEVDGADIAIKGMVRKVGEVATMEVRFSELSRELLEAAGFGMRELVNDGAWTKITPSAEIEEGHYWENIAFIGKTVSGKRCVVVMENALLTSGAAVDSGKGMEEKTYTFECHSEAGFGVQTLPWFIWVED